MKFNMLFYTYNLNLNPTVTDLSLRLTFLLQHNIWALFISKLIAKLVTAVVTFDLNKLYDYPVAKVQNRRHKLNIKLCKARVCITIHF